MEHILATKLYIPPPRRALVSRRRLFTRLDAGRNGKLTLVSAPAGYGKTTLISAWIQDPRGEQQASPVAWLSLDENDNDPVRFLTYLIAALRSVNAGLATGMPGALQSSQPPPANNVLTLLINELAAANSRIIFVLDDFHLIQAQAVLDILTFLLDHLPPQLHLIIATREDPLLPLSRLRARNQLTEVRAAELRFTSQEAAEFLNQVMGLSLSSEEVDALEMRTEGWIAGLQLAGLALQLPAAMQRPVDSAQFIRSFTGSHRLVLDYLIEEVLNRQPGEIQRFLQQTAILDRLSGPLCDALTGRSNGQATLEMLERANLFIVALDSKRHWYRYHHLFADLLQQRLRQTQPELQSMLHLRASEWYQHNDFTEQAIAHALRAQDFDRAATLAEQVWPEMHRNYLGVTWLRWVEALPHDLVRTRPVLSTGYGWSLIDTGDLEGADLHLQDAEQWLMTRKNRADRREIPPGSSELEGQASQSLFASIANARAYLAQARGDVAATEQYAQQALNLLSEEEYFERALSAILPGFAYWSSGDLDAAYSAISTAVDNMKMHGKVPFVISFTSYLADIMIVQGRLNETKRTCLQLLDLAGQNGQPELPETAVVHLVLSEILHEQGDLPAAKSHLQQSEALGHLPAFPPWYRHWVLARTRLKEVEGDLDGVLRILNEAEPLYYRHPIPDARPLAALIARAQLAAGRLTEAIDWVNERGLAVDDELSYLSEFEHLTLARILIARCTRDEDDGCVLDAIRLLERLLHAAEAGGRQGSAIEILTLLAHAFQAQDDAPAALEYLARALTLAEPQSYCQTFVNEGPSIARLLYETRLREAAPAYTARLLAAFPALEERPTDFSPSRAPEASWIEPLSEREIEVLELIAEGLTNTDIADRLYLSLNTIKAHTRNIYAKLDVHNRAQAIKQAQKFGYLLRK